MRNLLLAALLATAALSTGCNGIHKRGGCHGGACGGGHGGCPSGACGGGGGYAHAGCDACGDGRFGGGAHANGGGHFAGGGHFGGGQGQHGMQGVPHHFSREYLGPQGPSSAQVAYPYYTTRGPRDYFANEPMSIGR